MQVQEITDGDEYEVCDPDDSEYEIKLKNYLVRKASTMC